MGLNRDDICECVIQSLREVLGNSEVLIDEKTDPIRGLGLDSKDGVDLACVLSDKLNFDIPDKINPLLDDERNCPRRVGAITDLIHSLLNAPEDKKHARH